MSLELPYLYKFNFTLKMDKKRSLTITIISRFEMVIGMLGVIFAFPFLFLFLFGSESDGRIDGLAIALTWGVPAIFLLIMGELTFRLKPAGRIMHIVIPTLAIVLFSLQFFGPAYSILMPDFDSVPFLITICFLVIVIYFFTRPKIKELFRIKGTSQKGTP